MKASESENLFNQGKDALNSGDFTKAIDLLQKSLSLNPDEKTSKLLEKAKNSLKQTKPPSYSEEEENFAKSILSKHTHYEILSIEKSATQDQIKKAHKRLVIKLHPDKNQAPSSSEAFIKVQKAYECLSDESKRSHYDEYGEDLEAGPDFSHLFTKDGLIAVFAGLVMSSTLSPSHYMHKWFRSNEPEKPVTKGKYFTIIFFLLLILFSYLLKDPQLYSLTATPKFSQQVVSSRFEGFKFYVDKEEYEAMSLDFKKNLLEKVEDEMVQRLQKKCDQARSTKKEILSKMKNTDSMNSKLYQNYANSIDQTSCAELEKLFKPNSF